MFGCLGRGDLTFFSKVVKYMKVRGDLSSYVMNDDNVGMSTRAF